MAYSPYLFVSYVDDLISELRCSGYGVHIGSLKAAVVERFNRTLKAKMYRYFTYVNTKCYLNVLDDLLYSYNNTYHRSIEMSPAEVNEDNESVVRSRLYPPKIENRTDGSRRRR